MSAEGVLLLFLDGVGIGPADPGRNPFLAARLPVLQERLGTLPTLEAPRPDAGPGAAVAPLDATLGVEGRPQSGTGQASLLTGVNAARRFGRHFGPWVPVRLRPEVEERSVLRRAVDAGLTAAFANAYPRGWPGERGSRRVAGPPLAARGAGLLVRHEEALHEGRAVASEILNEGWRRHLGFNHLPRIDAAEAGRNLGRLAGDHRLTLFAHYSTDTAGHRGSMAGAVSALERVDAFLGGVLEALPPGHVTLVCSDHGNIEDLGVPGHTLHPALGLVFGPGAEERAGRLQGLTDVVPAVADWLGLSAV